MSDPASEIRVLVIDDSAFNRQTITSVLEAEPGIRVVARAGDGDEGLKQVFAHLPDVITLDLEMPKMDGFTFLRILMTRRPTPVIVISSYARKENVFKALELGALDFIAKPTQRISPELREIGKDLVQKVRLVSQLRVVNIGDRSARAAAPPVVDGAESGPLRVLAIGSSTGGPPALQQLLSTLDPRLPVSVVVAQHMPASFTGAFAERLHRALPFEVREARAGDTLQRGQVLICPGASNLAVVRHSDGSYRVRLESPGESRFVPSVDRLFSSVAEAAGAQAIGVLLSGMAGDGGRGARALKDAGAAVVVESPDSALVWGMPEEAVKVGAVDEQVRVSEMAAALARRLRR